MTCVSSGKVFAEDPGRLMVTVLAPSVSADELSEIWLELEQRSEASFFQSWGWIGTWYRCLPEGVERVVFQAHHSGRLVAMGILAAPRASGGRILSLHETGDMRFDAITIEHNGILCERDWATQHRSTLLEALVPLFPNMRRLRLPGVADAYRDIAAPTGFELSQVGTAPLFVLDLDDAGFSAISKGTAYKIRKAHRSYSRFGEVKVSEPRDPAEALAYLTEMASLHQRYWTRRGKSGAFANAHFNKFHRALIADRFASGEIQLLHVTAGPETLGYLYNFRYRNVVYAYQSGFNYDLIPNGRPGLLSHWEAVLYNRARGMSAYDFLAGYNQLKQSLANRQSNLYWMHLERPSPLYRIARWLRSARDHVRRT